MISIGIGRVDYSILRDFVLHPRRAPRLRAEIIFNYDVLSFASRHQSHSAQGSYVVPHLGINGAGTPVSYVAMLQCCSAAVLQWLASEPP